MKLIVPGHGLLTSLVGSFILLQTFLQIRLTFGVHEFLRGFVLFANGPRGCALELVAAMQEVVKRMELLTHPEPVLTSRVRAGHEANAAIRGHADAVEEVIAEVVTMGFPGLSRTI